MENLVCYYLALKNIATPRSPEIDETRWYNTVKSLSQYNRHSFHDQINEAMEFIVSQLSQIPRMIVKKQPVFVVYVERFNVVATIPGTKFPDHKFVIGAHYDSQNELNNGNLPAPGALDNASGSATVMELARILSKTEWPITLEFVLFAGEEQDFYGSKCHANSLKDTETVEFMLNVDMIGNTDTVIIESEPSHKIYYTAFKKAIEDNSQVPKLELRPWGSDHVTYLKRGIPSVLVANNHEEYKVYHTQYDTIENLNISSAKKTVQACLDAILALLQKYKK